jgi:hypothetical protein
VQAVPFFLVTDVQASGALLRGRPRVSDNEPVGSGRKASLVLAGAGRCCSHAAGVRRKRPALYFESPTDVPEDTVFGEEP